MALDIRQGRDQLQAVLVSQLRNLFLLSDDEEGRLLDVHLDQALERTARCFAEVDNKHFRDASGEPVFNIYNTNQYAVFLYFVSHVAGSGGDAELASKAYYLNKALNSCDLYFEIQLPRVFFFEHPIGTVLGRARYSPYLVVQQNCTVGGNGRDYPTLGEFVWLFAGATVIGDCTIGNNVFVAAGTMIKDEDVPDHSIVFGQSPNLVIKERDPAYFAARRPFLPK